MRVQRALIFVSLLFKICCCLWPTPKTYEHGSSVCWLSSDFHLILDPVQSTFWDDLPFAVPKCFYRVSLGHGEGGDLINAAFLRLKEAIRAHTFIPWKFYPNNADFEPESLSQNRLIRSLKVKYRYSLLSSPSKEAYDLSISEDCNVSLHANSPLGVLRALTTFMQLFYRHSHDVRRLSLPYMNTAPVMVSDAPAFEHRGLNLDISRNIIPPQDVIRTIDALALCKFNRLHLHASDAQSWPLEIPSLPELAAKGAYHSSQVWSVTDLHEVQQFGADRGVEVYIEMDMPGHTASVHQSYPELITSFNRKPWEKYSAQPPSGQLDLNSSAVHAFIETLLSDLLPRTKPFSPLFHLGGDEITAAAYNMTQTELRPFLRAFVDHAISIVKAHGLTPLVWEEQVLDYNLTLPANTVVQAWRGATASQPRSSLAELVGRGHRALFGSNDYWYLDCGHGTWIDPKGRDQGPSSGVEDRYVDYCTPYKNFRHILSYDPLVGIPPSQRHLVVGGEVHLWGELTDGVSLDTMLWPRVAAAGEVLWRGKGTVGEESTRRLAEMREWLVGIGVGSGPVQVTWCLMNAGNCVA